MDSSPSPGVALVAAAVGADWVTRLVPGWLAAKRPQNTRTACARDIGITPQRRASRTPSSLTWCQAEGVDPVTGGTGLHVAWYARQLEAVGIARPRAAPHTPPGPGLTRAQALALVHAADQATGPQRARTAALVALLLFTGARLSDVISADVADLGTSQGHRVLWVTRGNGRRQGLPLPRPAASRIDAYLAGRPGLAGVPVLFATRTAGRLFAADVRRVMRRLATRAGLPADQASHLGPRAIRHSSATL